MFRRIVATLTLVIAGLLAVPALASAATNPPYPAPPVTPATEAWTAATEPTAVAYNSVTDLASTGAGFSIGTALAIGAAVLVIGLALLVAGNRLRKSGSH